MCEILTVSERRACRVLGQVRRTQRYTSILSDEETALVTNVVFFGDRVRSVWISPHHSPATGRWLAVSTVIVVTEIA